MNIVDKIIDVTRVKLKKCLGIHISLSAIHLVDASIAGNSVKIEHYLKIPLPYVRPGGGKVSAMNVEFFLSDANWLAPLQGAIKQASFGSDKVVVTVSPQFAIFRHFLMPFIPRRFWKQSVPIESKKYVPFPFEESTYDFYPYIYDQVSIGKGRLGVFFAITNRQISDVITKGIKKIGFELMSLEVSSMSVDRIFKILGGNSNGGRAYAQIDAATAYLLLSNNGIPFLLREVDNSNIQSGERRRLDAKSSIEFVHKQVGTKIFNEIILSGEGLDSWKTALEDDSNLPVKPWNPKELLKLKDGEWAAYAAAGAAAKFMFPGQLSLDISTKVKTSVDDQKAFAYVWLAGIILAGFMLFVSLIAQFRLMGLNKNLSTVRSQTAEVPEFKGRSADEIQKVVEGMKTKSGILSALVADSDYVTPKLEAVVNAIPDNAWLSEISYSNTLQPGKIQAADNSFILKGNAKTGDAVKDQALANEYKEALKKEPAIAKIYSTGSGKIELNYTTLSKSQQNSLPEMQLPGQQAYTGETSFTISCSRKPEAAPR